MALHTGCSDNSRVALTRQHWRAGLPVLRNDRVILREVTAKDAASLMTSLATDAVGRYMVPAPASLDGFRRFVRWAQRERRRGTHACFAIVPAGQTDAVGIIQVWRLEPDFSTAEWGIAVGEAWWGRGLAHAAATALFEFAFTTLHAVRIEARAVAANNRGRKLMMRLGAAREGLLRHSFRRDALFSDQELWAVFNTTVHSLTSQERLLRAEC